jgi:transposase
MREVPDVIIPHAVTRCTSCGSPFTDFTDFTAFTAFTAFTESTPGKPLGELLGEVLDRRQVFDIVPAHLVVTEHQLIARKCEACGAYSVGDFPEDVRASVQYGSEVLALSVYLTAGQFLPLKRASELLGVIAGEPISQAALLSAEERAAEGLEETEREIFRLIQRSGVVHMDETGCFVEKKLHYLHDLSTTFLSHYRIHRKRGRKAFQDVGFLPSFHGVAVHDGCESYTASAYPCDHALCGAHLLRDLTFVEEEEKKEWAGKLKRLLRAMKRAKERAIEQGRTVLERRSLARYERRYTRLLEEADRAEPPPEPRSGKSGPRRRTAGRNLLERLERQRAMVTRFLHDFRVPFDNSESERDLRMMKLKQKISGGFRTMEGARRFARIRGYLNTARKQGHSPLEVLRDFFRGHPYQPAIAPPE